jgi:hypothetical protein
MLIKVRSFVSILLSASLIAGLTIIGVAPGSSTNHSFAALTGVPHLQTFPNIQDVNTSTLSSASSLSQKQQQPLQLSGTIPHLVKIISPTKGQQVRVGKDLTIYGISSDNSKTSGCKVSVIVNGNKPYRTAYPAGQADAGDYSKWNFTLTHSYASFKEGQNKITAKFSCGNDPNSISHNSVNVTGVTGTFSSDANQQLQHQYTGQNSIDKKLSSDNSNSNSNSNNNNVEHSHSLSIISIPHIKIPHTEIPFHLPFH